MFLNVFCLKLSSRDDYVKIRDAGARRIRIADDFDPDFTKKVVDDENSVNVDDISDSEYCWTSSIDFQGAERNLLEFICNYYYCPVSTFGSLLRFESECFNQPVANFGNLKHLKCPEFDQPIQSFENL